MTLLVKNAEVLVTMDGQRTEIPGGGLFIRDGFIEKVGPTASLPQTADEVLDLSGHVVLPGLINTHHHLFQTLTRATPEAQNCELFPWLVAHYPFWKNLTPVGLATATTIGAAELALSGCTTVFDHCYTFPNGCRIEDQLEAAGKVGVRFHASRGCMVVGDSQGGMGPDAMTETADFVLRDSRRAIEKFHDAKPGAMTRIVLAPCAIFSVTADLFRETAKLARAYGVRLHTHLAETLDEQQYTLEKFNKRPLEYMETLDWIGPDVWFAHTIHVNDAEIAQYARTGCGAAHCPSSNMRLASGIAPVKEMRAAGVNVGLGVDGSASNDSSHMLAEARMALLLARIKLAEKRGEGPPKPKEWMTAREALEIGTRGGAAVLGRDDIGSLQPGKCADFIAIDLNRIDFAGAHHDPVAAVVFCSPQTTDYTVVNGKFVVKEGKLATLDIQPVIERQNRLACEMRNQA